MAVGGVGWDDEEKRARFLLVTHGTLDQITDDFPKHDGFGLAISLPSISVT